MDALVWPSSSFYRGADALEGKDQLQGPQRVSVRKALETQELRVVQKDQAWGLTRVLGVPGPFQGLFPRPALSGPTVTPRVASCLDK